MSIYSYEEVKAACEAMNWPFEQRYTCGADVCVVRYGADLRIELDTCDPEECVAELELDAAVKLANALERAVIETATIRNLAISSNKEL